MSILSYHKELKVAVLIHSVRIPLNLSRENIKKLKESI